MIDPKTGVALEAVSPVRPEGVDPLVWMQVPDGVSSPPLNQTRISLPDFRSQKSVVDPSLGLVNIKIARRDVVVPGQDDGDIELEEFICIFLKLAKPSQLVVEFRPRRWISVWQIQTADKNSVDCSFDMPRMGTLRAAWQSFPSEKQFLPPGENRDTIPSFLAVPDGSISCAFDLPEREVDAL